jgi:hypothetical protein
LNGGRSTWSRDGGRYPERQVQYDPGFRKHASRTRSCLAALGVDVVGVAATLGADLSAFSHGLISDQSSTYWGGSTDVRWGLLPIVHADGTTYRFCGREQTFEG